MPINFEETRMSWGKVNRSRPTPYELGMSLNYAYTDYIDLLQSMLINI